MNLEIVYAAIAAFPIICVSGGFMLREFDLQRMHWADKTQSMLHQRQMEACEARLLSYPTESIFTLQDERATE